jgi:hypothetical protein
MEKATSEARSVYILFAWENSGREEEAGCLYNFRPRKKKNNIVRHEEILMGFDWLPGIRALPS